MKKRRWPWLVVALVLIAVGAWLMAREDPERVKPAWATVPMPRQMTPSEQSRADLRRTWAPPTPAAAPTPDTPEPAPAHPRDPVLAALPSKIEHAAVVVEANAIRHSPVGELLVECMTSSDGGQGLQRFREEFGVNPLEDLDRVAFADDTLILSGQFQNAKLGKLVDGPGIPHGRDGTVFHLSSPDGGADREMPVIGTWAGQMFVMGSTDEEVEAVLDRLDGKGLGGAPVLDESLAYGDMYGVLSPKALAELLPQDQRAIADRLAQAAQRIELHADASRDVGIVADVRGMEEGDTTDLGKSMGAALAVARLKAQADGKDKLAELLDYARVVPGDGQFRMEMGLPLEVLEKQLKDCVARNQARRQEAEAAQPAAAQ